MGKGNGESDECKKREFGGYISPLINIILGDNVNISVEVTGDLLKYLDAKVQRGLYKSRSEVVRSAIRQMIQMDLEEMLKAKGLTPEEFEEIRSSIAGEKVAKKYKKLASGRKE